MQFSLDEWTEVTLTHVSKRTEVHGQDRKHAMDLAWKIEGPSTLLDRFPGDMRGQLYYGDSSMDIPGVQPVTPHLRPKSFEPPYKHPYDGTGYLITVEDGAVSGAKFELAGVDLNKVAVTPKDGGSMILTFRTQHVGLNGVTMGRICEMDGKKVRMLAAPPEMQDGTLPVKQSKAQKAAQAKAEAEAAFQTPFKYSTDEKGGLVDNNPAGIDPNPPEAGDVFGEKVANGETTPAPAQQPASKKVVKLKPKARTGKG